MSNSTKWRDTRLKNLFTSVRNGVWGDDPDEETDVFCARGTDFDRVTSRISDSKMPRRNVIPSVLRDHQLQRGDLILEKSGGSADQPVGSVALFDLPIRAVCSNFNARLQVGNSVDPRFACYMINSLYWSGFTRQFVKQTTGIQNLDAGEFLVQHCLLPRLDEQRRIADFLDAETARIDALAASRRAQISVLDELEMARIGEHLHAGKKIGPVYAYFDVQLGKMLNAERASGGNQQPYLRNANVQWYEIDTEDMATMTFESHENLRYRLQPGDLLVCEGGYVGRSAVWDGRIETCFYQKSLHRVRARTNVPVEWLMYWLRYANATGIFEAEGNLTTIAHLTGEQLAEYRIPIPEDGHRRVAELASGIATIRETQRNMAAANSLLAERRQGLITAAVTGQIDVTSARGVAV